MKPLLLLALAASLVSLNAHADGQTAAQKLRANLQRMGAAGAANFADVQATPTLVRNMYRLNARNGEFLGYVNEAGTVHGDARGFNVFPATGAKPRQLTPDEVVKFRREVMRNVAYDKLIKVGYGDGGGRKLLMFSAIDCPACKVLESTAQRTRNLHTTFYVLPASLQAMDDGGQDKMEIVSRLWCADDSGGAWKAFWAKWAVPAARQCQFDPRSAELARADLRDILKGAGTRLDGFPAVLAEDGMPAPRHGSAQELRTAWGALGTPATGSGAGQWLPASSAISGGGAPQLPGSKSIQK